MTSLCITLLPSYSPLHCSWLSLSTSSKKTDGELSKHWFDSSTRRFILFNNNNNNNDSNNNNNNECLRAAHKLCQQHGGGRQFEKFAKGKREFKIN